MSWGMAFSRGLAGLAQGLAGAEEQRRLARERAEAKEFSQWMQRQELARNERQDKRQGDLDVQAATQRGIDNKLAMQRQAVANTSAGFSPYQDGMVDGTTQQAVDGAREMASGNPMAGMMAGAADVMRVKGQQEGKRLADAQGGWIKTGQSDQERIREDDRAARREATAATLAGQNQRASEANQLRRDLAAITAGNRGNAAAEKAAAKVSQSETRLRSQYEANPVVKNAYTIANAMENVRAAATTPDAAGDLSLIFAYMKMLDPNSVVRETEFANAQNAAGIPDQVRNLWNRALSGERLNPNQRTQFLQRATQLGESSRKQLMQQNARYSAVAKAQGVDPEMVIYDPFQNIMPQQSAPAVVPRQPGESIAQWRARTGGR